MSHEHTKKLTDLFLARYNLETALPKTIDSPFNKFDESKVFIPWYLKPFSKKIKSIARHHFVDGYYSNLKGASDTVTFKRPKEYASKL